MRPRNTVLGLFICLFVVTCVSSLTAQSLSPTATIPDTQDLKNEILQTQAQVRTVEQSVTEWRKEVRDDLQDLKRDVNEAVREQRTAQREDQRHTETIFVGLLAVISIVLAGLSIYQQRHYTKPESIQVSALQEILQLLRTEDIINADQFDKLWSRVTEKVSPGAPKS
jgi:sensor c-di-GMP phosphodiesterase-like protein